MSRNQLIDKAKLLEHLNRTPVVEIACKRMGIARSTYYRWRKDDEDFALSSDEAIEQSTAMVNDMAESQLISAIKEKNMTAIIFWLKHHHRAYRTRLEIDARIKNERQELTAEEAEMVAAALRLSGLTNLTEGVQDEPQ